MGEKVVVVGWVLGGEVGYAAFGAVGLLGCCGAGEGADEEGGGEQLWRWPHVALDNYARRVSVVGF